MNVGTNATMKGVPCNQCCRGKAMSITHFERVPAAFFIQYTMRMRHIVICSLSGSTVSFHIIS